MWTLNAWGTTATAALLLSPSSSKKKAATLSAKPPLLQLFKTRTRACFIITFRKLILFICKIDVTGEEQIFIFNPFYRVMMKYLKLLRFWQRIDS